MSAKALNPAKADLHPPELGVRELAELGKRRSAMWCLCSAPRQKIESKRRCRAAPQHRQDARDESARSKGVRSAKEWVS